MKNSIKKLMALAMLLSFAITSSASSIAMAADGDLLAYSLDYMPEIRGSQPSVVSLSAQKGISDKELPVTLSLRDSDVKQVLRMFADKAGLNIIFKGDVKGNVTMDLVNIPLNTAFDMVMTSQNLSYSLKDNTLMITDAAKSAGLTRNEMAVIPVKYINAAQAAHFLNVNIFGNKRPGFSGTDIASTNPATNEIIIFGNDNDVQIARNVIAQLDKKPMITSFKVNHTTPKEMADMICKLLLPGTGAFMGENASGGAAPITGGAADLYTDAARGVMTGAASESSGSSIELGSGNIACASAIMNEASESSSGGDGEESSKITSLDAVGITVAYYTQLGTISVTGATPHQIEMVKEFIASNDRRQPQAYIEFSIIELNEDGTREFNNEWAFVSKHFNFKFDSGSGTTYSPTGTTYKFGGHRPEWTTATPQLLYNLSVVMKNGKARLISNPRVLATNGQESVIDLTSDYVKSVKSQYLQSASGMGVATVERTYEIGDDDGIKISVTPFISPDGYVYLNINPEIAAVKEQVGYQGETGEKVIEATLLSRSNLDIKNVRLKDEETLVLGGLMREEERKTVKKIPFLGDIPGLGTFFRSSSVEKVKRELVILITPKILTDNDEPTASL